ncbi:unnamed protein product [Lactuca virosa]|uniref:Uncharacterized protein n=2 Tax=Lactuca TaxID=4235 RepID=A0AA35USJ4_LACSI|nr:unnamed protein product [Lactuca virosa]CAI9262465.1 unnamed protein product [Lactuca saligna]CAI9264311.1 unnamed protein product [Lactuca saligna]CAI9265331.1 unnamed protein product [Lactuca saligna]
MQRCSSKAGIRDCPLHRPEEQWLCCFARLRRETQKVPTLNRKKDKSTICLTHAPGIPGVRTNFLLEGRLGKSIERAGSALALLPSAKLRREKKHNSPSGFISGIVGRMKWDEALVGIASVTGRRLGRSGSGRLARKSLLW